jgi:O-antigen ligase
VFFLAAHWIRSLIWLKRLTWIFIGMASIYVLGRLIPPLGSVTTMTLPTGAAGSMVWTWLVALAFGQAVYNRGLGGWLRLLLLGVVLATFFIHSAQVQGWASGWVPALVAVLVVLWLLTPRLALVMTIVGMVIVGFNLESFLNLLLKGNQYSYETRLEAWRILLHMVRVNPLLGLGPANYYSYAPGFPILGFSVRFSSHNNYIDLIAQTGYLGLACFVWFATAMGVLCRRIIRRVPSGFAKAYAYGALGGLAGTLVSGMLGDWFLPFVYNVGIDGLGASLFAWLFMGGLVALGRLVLTREESLAPTPDLA